MGAIPQLSFLQGRTVLFDNTYARLPERFFARQQPAEVKAPSLVAWNESVASQLGITDHAFSPEQRAQLWSGNRLPDGTEPIAMAYAGHQFGGFVPQLGDGRALLLGEVLDGQGVRWDLQLKGAGRTPFSRGGDGRAALGPVLREYMISEAMHVLGVPTTRALAAVATGEPVMRDRVLPGAVLTRVARSHVRVGTFQFFAARGDTEALQALTDYLLDRHRIQPGASAADAVLQHAITAQARLVARWAALGFIHGVMNTDNTSVIGETIDYGPCAFMDVYDPKTVFSSIDHRGRYAYANQPGIAQWNLARLAECLLPLLHTDQSQAIKLAEQAIADFESQFRACWLQEFGAKLGLADANESDRPLIQSFLDLLAQARADFSLSFRTLCEAADGNYAALDAAVGDVPAYRDWLPQWQKRLQSEPDDAGSRMRQVNPWIIPRNHQVEAVLEAAVNEGDFEPFERLHAALANPFTERADAARYAQAPPAGQPRYQTFCGT